MGRKRRARPGCAILDFAQRSTPFEDIDTSFVPDSYHDGVLEGPRPSCVIAKHAAGKFCELFMAGADCFNLKRKQSQALLAMIGKGGMPLRLLLCCLPTRLQLTTELTQQWRDHWKQHRRDSYRQYMFITFITDSGNTLAREPKVDLEALHRRADKLLRGANLHGIFVIEVQLISNFPRQGHGATHSWHVHCIATVVDKFCDVEKLQADLRKSGRLSNIFDAPTVKIKPIRSLAHLMRCCTYMLKAPAVGKYLTPHEKIPEAWTFKKAFVRKDEALRLGEALSQVEFGQVVHSVGDGKHLLRPAMKALRAWHKARYAKARIKLPDDFDVSKIWAEIRDARSKNRNLPYVFTKSGDCGHSDAWMAAAKTSLKAINAARARDRKSHYTNSQSTRASRRDRTTLTPKGSALERLNLLIPDQ